MSDLIDRYAAIDALGERPIVWTDDNQYALGERNQYDIDRLAIETLPPAQPDRSLWFRIGEICVDESKGFISAGRAVEKIRELLREAERRENGSV